MTLQPEQNEQAAKQPSTLQLLQRTGSSTERKSKSLPLPLGSHLCNHAASAPEMLQTWVVSTPEQAYSVFKIYAIHISPSLPSQRNLENGFCRGVHRWFTQTVH